MSAALSVYSAAAQIAFPFIRGRLRKSHPTGFAERCGVYDQSMLERISGRKTFWLHAVSVGEVQAAAPVVAEVVGAGWDGAVVLSTVTETGAQNAGDLMGASLAARVYAPWDIPSIVRRARGAIRPTLYASVETEVWPNLLAEMKKNSVPALLLNARISDRTFARAGALRRLLGEAYGMFDAILARGEEDARRLFSMGLTPGKVVVTGDTKIDAIVGRKKAVESELGGLRKKIFAGGGKTVCFVAGSTHEGEEETVLDAFSKIASGGLPVGVKLVIAPRHPRRAEAVLSLARRRFAASLYSELNDESGAQVVVVDVIGVLFGLYGLATAAFIGGSLVPKGGQNILEPAVWRVPVLHGPHMEDFADPCSKLDASKDAFRVDTAGEIETLWRKAAAGELTRRVESPEDYFAANSGAAARTREILEKYL
ncbi:MAG: 3-deoxy-D-manno-octulosonic acid transferase [Synergistaceae bacterium]|jgi:3-deoxy-D-manno-octulosonic-acid transferase|nr:3-deoxy-D-manno-octulosonic acid transferase [Synergistaceae bacterium]